MLAPANGVADRFQLWVLTALGNPSPSTAAGGDKLHAIASGVGLLAGGVALGLGISLMSAYFIDRRLDEAMRRRARRVRRHVVVVGLGDVGLRIAQLLDGLGVPCVVLDTDSPTENESRRRSRRVRSPVIPGELEAGLPAAGVHRALSLIATSENNVLNVEACLRAKRDGPKGLQTIARIFDEENLERSAEAFGVERPIAAVSVAAPAFVEAALADECLRTFGCDDHALAAVRWPCGLPFGSRQMQRWHEDGVRLLAVWREGEGVRPPGSATAGLAENEAGILAGPDPAMVRVLEELGRRRPPHDTPALRLAS
jgi:Trk K+ transport system NAD-binding subunit